LAWDPTLRSESIVEEWTRLTFGNDTSTVGTIDAMLLSSWAIYESYTGPLGAGTLTDILGSHYGPGIESSANPPSEMAGGNGTAPITMASAWIVR
jgi:alpha-glucuronidase